jgi:hypothetical protein
MLAFWRLSSWVFTASNDLLAMSIWQCEIDGLCSDFAPCVADSHYEEYNFS